MTGTPATIRFIVGSRQVLGVPRRLTTVSCSLEQLLSGTLPPIPPLAEGDDGYRFLSVPESEIAALLARYPGYLVAGRQDYERRYIAMTGSFDDYLGLFSGKTRSTLKRKRRKMAELVGGEVEVAEFHRSGDMARFFAEALPLSSQTYQARLLDAGLPDDPAFRAESERLAEAGRLRAYILRANGKAAAYLYLPVEGETLVYAYLGYDPALAQASPGTVLQLDALERLYAERRFGYFDFTEGDGAHKQMFGTHACPAASFYLLRPTLANRAIVSSLALFDGSVAMAKALLERTGAGARVRKLLKR